MQHNWELALPPEYVVMKTSEEDRTRLQSLIKELENKRLLAKVIIVESVDIEVGEEEGTVLETNQESLHPTLNSVLSRRITNERKQVVLENTQQTKLHSPSKDNSVEKIQIGKLKFI